MEPNFETVVQQYSKWIYHLSYRMTGDHHTAMDLVQEVSLHLYYVLKKYDTQQEFEPWLKTVVCRKILNLLRKMPKKEYSMEFLDEEFSCPQESFPSLSEEKEEILKLLDTLDYKYRIPLVLMYLENKKVQEIAEWMEVSENTVKTWLRRGRKELFAKWKDSEKTLETHKP